MCIRDRFQACGAEILGVNRGTVGFLASIDRKQDIEEALEAVSYTHLRAHETVLDFVCRLLLEKKKIINLKLLTRSI